MAPLTLRTGVATLHGSNLMDAPYGVPETLLHWLEVAARPGGTTFRQSSPEVHRLNAWDDWEADPSASRHQWNGSGAWVRLDGGTDPGAVSGRLIGGCLETLANLAGTPSLDTGALRAASPDGLIIYVEASGAGATQNCRQLHGMRWAGFFEGARAILVGRTGAPDATTLSQDEAVVDALGKLGVPMVGNVECGHVPPQLPSVNGAMGPLVFTDGERFLEQTLR